MLNLTHLVLWFTAADVEPANLDKVDMAARIVPGHYISIGKVNKHIDYYTDEKGAVINYNSAGWKLANLSIKAENWHYSTYYCYIIDFMH